MHATALVDDARCVVVDGSGTIFFAGASNTTDMTTGSAYVEARSPSGQLLWSTNYDASPGGPEVPSAIALDGAGGIYVAGAAANTTPSQWGAFLLRIDSTGAITWSRERAATGSHPWVPTLAVDPSGRAILGGRALAGPYADLSIAAYSTSGGLDWEFTYDFGLPAPDEIADLAFAPNGDIVGAGTGGVTTQQHPTVVRVTPTGQLVHVTLIWNAEVTNGRTVSVAVDSGDRTFVASSSNGPGQPGTTLAISALDAHGAYLWSRMIPGPQQPNNNGAGSVDMVLDALGRPVVLGWRAKAGSYGSSTVAVAHDRDGNEIWRRIVDDVLGTTSTSSANFPVRLVISGDGELIAVGTYCPQPLAPICNAYVLGFDATGEQRFGFTYDLPPMSGSSYDYAGSVAASPGSGFVLVGRAQTAAGSAGFDAYYARFSRTAVGFCFGDGSGTPCPCGNVSQPVERAGCATSFGIGGRLADLGASSLSNDTLALIGSAMPNSSALYFQGTTALPGTAFGDGLRCAGGTVLRLGVKTNASGTSRYPVVGDLSVSQRGMVAAPGSRTYQVWFRNSAAFCTSATFGLTNGLAVAWTL